MPGPPPPATATQVSVKVTNDLRSAIKLFWHRPLGMGGMSVAQEVAEIDPGRCRLVRSYCGHSFSVWSLHDEQLQEWKMTADRRQCFRASAAAADPTRKAPPLPTKQAAPAPPAPPSASPRTYLTEAREEARAERRAELATKDGGRPTAATLQREASSLDCTIKKVESTLRRKRELDDHTATAAAQMAAAKPLPPATRAAAPGSPCSPMLGSSMLAKGRALVRAGNHDEALAVFKQASQVLEARGIMLQSKPVLAARIAALEKIVNAGRATKSSTGQLHQEARPTKAESSDSESQSDTDSDDEGSQAVAESPFAKRLKAAASARLTSSASNSSVGAARRSMGSVTVRFSEADRAARSELLDVPSTDRAAAAATVGSQRWVAMSWVERLAMVKVTTAAAAQARQAAFDKRIFNHGRSALGSSAEYLRNHFPSGREHGLNASSPGGRCSTCTLPLPCGKVHVTRKRSWASVVAEHSAKEECGLSQPASKRERLIANTARHGFDGCSRTVAQISDDSGARTRWFECDSSDL